MKGVRRPLKKEDEKEKYFVTMEELPERYTLEPLIISVIGLVFIILVILLRL